MRFLKLASHSKDVMVLYFVDTMDWNEYIDVKEEINYKIVDIVEGHGAAFAFPTQTLHLQRSSQKPISALMDKYSFAKESDIE